jgi:hypothetical protein
LVQPGARFGEVRGGFGKIAVAAVQSFVEVLSSEVHQLGTLSCS